MDIRSILSTHNPRYKKDAQDPEVKSSPSSKLPTTSDIPDLFFDEILVNYKLNRMEIMVLMYLYRLVWCRPNLHRMYGIGPLLSYNDTANVLNITRDDLYSALRKIEGHGFIETIRPGQYFVRKYFTETNDALYGQHYDDFL